MGVRVPHQLLRSAGSVLVTETARSLGGDWPLDLARRPLMICSDDEEQRAWNKGLVSITRSSQGRGKGGEVNGKARQANARRDKASRLAAFDLRSRGSQTQGCCIRGFPTSIVSSWNSRAAQGRRSCRRRAKRAEERTAAVCTSRSGFLGPRTYMPSVMCFSGAQYSKHRWRRRDHEAHIS